MHAALAALVSAVALLEVARAGVVQLLDATSTLCPQSAIVSAIEQSRVRMDDPCVVISSLAGKYTLDTALLNEIFQTSLVADEEGAFEHE
jgi:hypothetical protein